MPKLCCRLGFCDRPAYTRDQLCRAHGEQQRRGTPLRPIEPRVRNRGCDFGGCPDPHKAHGWCAAHLRQVERGQTPHRVVKRGPQPRKPRRPKEELSSSALPDGWGRPAKKPRVKRVVDKTQLQVMTVPPMDPRTMAAMLAGLRQVGAEDLADVLGVTPGHIRAEAERWQLWRGAAA